MSRLRNLRKQKGVSQRIVAEQLGITQAAYSLYELGKRQADYNTLIKLSDYFHVSTDYLLGKTDNPLTLDQQLEGEQFALYGEIHDLSDDEKTDILSYIKFKKSQRGEAD